MYEFLKDCAPFLTSPIYQILFLGSSLIICSVLRWRAARFMAVLVLLHILFFSSRFGLSVTVKPLEDAYPPVVEAKPLNAVVVLSGGTLQYDKSINQNKWGHSAPRFLEAIRLYHMSGSKFFVITGGTPDYTGALDLEAASMYRAALEAGINKSHIILEPNAQTTALHPVELKKFFDEKHIQSFYLVTSAYHMMRALKVFEKQGFTPTAYPVDSIYDQADAPFSFSYYLDQAMAVHEWMGLWAYSVSGFI